MKYKVGDKVVLISGNKCIIGGITKLKDSKKEYEGIVSPFIKGETIKDKSGFINTEIGFTNDQINHEKTAELNGGKSNAI